MYLSGHKYCSQFKWAFQSNFLHEKPIFFSLLAFFFVPLSLENSKKEKEKKIRWLESSNPGSFWLGSINQQFLGNQAR